MSETKNKRNYIRRKKYLNDCVAQIKTTLEFIHLAHGEPGNQAESQKLAVAHAQAIEAACWSPHSRLSAEGYQKLMMAKTQELCRAIIKKSLPNLDLAQITKLHFSGRPSTPQTPIPKPVVAPIKKTPHISMDDDDLHLAGDWGAGSLVTSFEVGLNGDLPSNDFMQDSSSFIMIDDPEILDISITRFEHQMNDDMVFATFY